MLQNFVTDGHSDRLTKKKTDTDKNITHLKHAGYYKRIYLKEAPLQYYAGAWITFTLKREEIFWSHS